MYKEVNSDWPEIINCFNVFFCCDFGPKLATEIGNKTSYFEFSDISEIEILYTRINWPSGKNSSSCGEPAAKRTQGLTLLAN